MKNNFLKGLVASFALAVSGLANAGLITIDFESDSTGGVSNGFSSVDASGVYFSDSVGSNLSLGNYGSQGDGTSLAVSSDLDGSELIINFDFLISFLSLDFGNDDAGYSSPGDLATLTLFNSGVQVGISSVVLNRDDIMNQTVSFEGLLFDSARFSYTNSQYSPIGLTEVVDNISFQNAAVDVPEPSTLAVFALGLMGLVSRKLKKQA